MLILSVIIITPPALAVVTIISITPSRGPVGTSVRLHGSIDTYNGDYRTYFDSDADGTGEAGEVVKTGTANGTRVEPTFIVPPSINGTRILWLNDVATANNATACFTVVWAPTPPVVEATVDINPQALNLMSKGKWITSCIKLPEGYNLSDVDVYTILLNNISAEDWRVHERFLTAKFGKVEVVSYILANINMTELFEDRFIIITLTVTGNLNDGTPYQGSDKVRIIMPMRVRVRRFLKTPFPMPL